MTPEVRPAVKTSLQRHMKEKSHSTLRHGIIRIIAHDIATTTLEQKFGKKKESQSCRLGLWRGCHTYFFGFSLCFFKVLSFSMADQWKTAGPKTTHESTFGARAQAMQTF
jgi:hypothetical protein